MDRNYRDYDYEFGQDMLTVAGRCGRFARRHDICTFNMGDYQSCENCRHYTPDNLCARKADNGMYRFE